MEESRLSLDLIKTMEKRLAKLDIGPTGPCASVWTVSGNPLELVASYVPPLARVQTGPGAIAPTAPLTPAFDRLNEFLNASGTAAPLLVLGESGFGKTSLLSMLHLSQILGHWPSGERCVLLPAVGDIEETLRSIPEPASATLLLDGLDEHPRVKEAPGPRLRSLLDACLGFRRVIITCHNRFFLRELAGGRALDLPTNRPPPQTMLLTGFDDEMIAAYLEKRYPASLFRGKQTARAREQAWATAQRVGRHRFCPLLLSRVSDLDSLEPQTADEYSILESIALRWLLDESERLSTAGDPNASVESIYALLKRIAAHCAENEAYAIPKSELDRWSAAEPGRPTVTALSFDGRSLLRHCATESGEIGFRLAHSTYLAFIAAQNILDESGPEEIVVPAYASERIVDFVVKGRSSDEEHRGKKLVLRNLKLATFGFDKANLQGAVIEGADLRNASFKRADLSSVEFRDCQLDGADFKQAITTGACLDTPTPGLPFALELASGIRLELLWVNPGTFVVGEDQSTNRVEFRHGFWLARTPFTQDQYHALNNANPSFFARLGKNLPVEQVSWSDAQTICQKLTTLLPDAKSGSLHFRLPTETEWEYVCRAGTVTNFSFGDDEGELVRFGWSSRNSDGQTQPVGLKLPNPWGFHDMHGNVWEWCQDWSSDFLKGVISDLRGPAERSERVIRGGSWSNGPYSCRSAKRNWHAPSARYNNLGFRVALVREPPSSQDAKTAIGM